MSKLTQALTLALALPFAQAAFAQTTASDAAAAPKADTAQTAPKADSAGGGLSMGQTVEGSMYVKDTQGDWEVRCYHTKDKKDPCEMYQLMKDAQNNPVAEISLFPLQNSGQAVAGATIVTPLETLLTHGVTIAIDGGGAKSYPFSWCTAGGCISRVGLTKEDLTAYEKGTQASVQIVAAQQPGKPILLPMSLKGFTAAFDEVSKNNAGITPPTAPKQ